MYRYRYCKIALKTKSLPNNILAHHTLGRMFACKNLRHLMSSPSPINKMTVVITDVRRMKWPLEMNGGIHEQKNKIQNMAINFVTCSTLGNVVSPKWRRYQNREEYFAAFEEIGNVNSWFVSWLFSNEIYRKHQRSRNIFFALVGARQVSYLSCDA